MAPVRRGRQSPEKDKSYNDRFYKQNNFSKRNDNAKKCSGSNETLKNHYMDQPRPEVRPGNNNFQFDGPPS